MSHRDALRQCVRLAQQYAARSEQVSRLSDAKRLTGGAKSSLGDAKRVCWVQPLPELHVSFAHLASRVARIVASDYCAQTPVVQVRPLRRGGGYMGVGAAAGEWVWERQLVSGSTAATWRADTAGAACPRSGRALRPVPHQASQGISSTHGAETPILSR
jgi:hypothetical protein